MSAVEKLQDAQTKNNSHICLGLDLDPKRMPQDYTKSIKGMYEFTMNIIEATKDQVCAYKPNMAFYENLGHDGISLLETIVHRMPQDIPIILDGKRGDIGNTASFYAEAMYDKLRADWVTLSPYMGYDSMRPFLEHKDKGIFVLCLTSNTGSKDFQLLNVDGKPLYKVVAEKVDYWNKEDNCGLVVGATNPEQLKELREIARNMPLLIPGVGAQGGSLEKAIRYGTDEFNKLAVINVSRSVLFASNGADYAERAREELIKLNETVKKIKSGEYTGETEEETKPQEQQQTQQPPQQQQSEPPKQQFSGFTPPKSEPPKQESPQPETPKPEQPKLEEKPEQSHPSDSQQHPPQSSLSVSISSVPSESQTQSQPATPSELKSATPPTTPEPKPEHTSEQEPQEPKKTPPPLPTPPPPLRPNPEVIQRNREEQERRQKMQQEQQQQQQSGEQGQSQQQGSNDQNRSFKPRHHKFNRNRNGRNFNNQERRENHNQNSDKRWDKNN